MRGRARLSLDGDGEIVLGERRETGDGRTETRYRRIDETKYRTCELAEANRIYKDQKQKNCLLFTIHMCMCTSYVYSFIGIISILLSLSCLFINLRDKGYFLAFSPFFILFYFSFYCSFLSLFFAPLDMITMMYL